MTKELQQFHDKLLENLKAELSHQDKRGDARFESGRNTLGVDGMCYGIEKAIIILEKTMEEFK